MRLMLFIHVLTINMRKMISVLQEKLMFHLKYIMESKWLKQNFKINIEGGIYIDQLAKYYGTIDIYV